MLVPSFNVISQMVSELLSGHILKFTKGYKNVHVVTVLVLCTLPDDALYLSQNL